MRVRAWVSPSGRPANGESAGIGNCSVSDLVRAALQIGEPGHQLRSAEQLGDHVGFLLVEGDRLGRAVTVLVVDDDVAVAVTSGHDADPASVVQFEFLAHTDARQHPVGDVDIHPVQTTGMTSVGTLAWTTAVEPLVAAPVAAALAAWPQGDLRAAPIDPAVADTAEFCARYDVPLEQSANCVVIAGRRAGETSYAACVVLATTRADVNGVVRRLLGARKAIVRPDGRRGRAHRDGVWRHHADRVAARVAGADRSGRARAAVGRHRQWLAPVEDLLPPNALGRPAECAVVDGLAS